MDSELENAQGHEFYPFGPTAKALPNPNLNYIHKLRYKRMHNASHIFIDSMKNF